MSMDVTPEFSAEEFCRMMDLALTSNNEGVQTALRNLVLLASLAQDSKAGNVPGPLSELFSNIEHLKRRINSLEATVKALDQKEHRYLTDDTAYKSSMMVRDYAKESVDEMLLKKLSLLDTIRLTKFKGK